MTTKKGTRWSEQMSVSRHSFGSFGACRTDIGFTLSTDGIKTSIIQASTSLEFRQASLPGLVSSGQADPGWWNIAVCANKCSCEFCCALKNNNHNWKWVEKRRRWWHISFRPSENWMVTIWCANVSSRNITSAVRLDRQIIHMSSCAGHASHDQTINLFYFRQR